MQGNPGGVIRRRLLSPLRRRSKNQMLRISLKDRSPPLNTSGWAGARKSGGAPGALQGVMVCMFVVDCMFVAFAESDAVISDFCINPRPAVSAMLSVVFCIVPSL